ncbi:hypothetical protein DFH05DRAFT_1524811 [Lentinula detonsa]|uniref:Uncharacterized protein n=1 Tax=Lentinula detonsa TaxID=2804962 RepID=A0A9W8P1R7_9AGAR|nr:hypothetical protein DFH05DRAFT_1524811 [Lentinula detonsa]
MSHPHSVHHVLNHQHGSGQYIHYTGPPPTSTSSTASPSVSNINAGTNTSSSSSRTTSKPPTTTTPQSVLNNASPQPSPLTSAMTMTTVAPQDTTTKFVHHQPQYAGPLYQYRHYQPPQPQVTQGGSGVPEAQGLDTSGAGAGVSTVSNTSTAQPNGSTTTTNTGNTTASTTDTNSTSNGPLVATGDWTRNLVHLAKTAELKKHALTLQLHTAHILSAHAALEQKSKSIQDVKEQRNKLESERTRLLSALRQVNEDRDKADLLEGDLERDCTSLRSQILTLSDGDYAIAKADVDRLRAELGQPPLPSLQTMLDEKASSYLTERRLNGNSSNSTSGAASTSASTSTSFVPSATPTTFQNSFSAAQSASSSTYTNENSHKRPVSSPSVDPSPGDTVPSAPAKRPRGRPKGSKTQKRT